MKKVLTSFLLTFIITGAVFAFIYALTVADTKTNNTLTGEPTSFFWTKDTKEGTIVSIFNKEIFIKKEIMDKGESITNGIVNFYKFCFSSILNIISLALNWFFSLLIKLLSLAYSLGVWIG